MIFFKNNELILLLENDRRIIKCPICHNTDEVNHYIRRNQYSLKKNDFLHVNCASSIIYENNMDFSSRSNYGFVSSEKVPEKKVHIQEINEYKKNAIISFIKPNIIIINHPYNSEIIKKYHQYQIIFSKIHNNSWILNIEKVNLETLNFIQKLEGLLPEYNWDITPEAIKKLKNKYKELNEKQHLNNALKQIKVKNEIKGDELNFDMLKQPPMHHQKTAMVFLDKINGVGMIGDEAGVGKSLVAIGYTYIKKAKTCIVSTASSKYNWINEIKINTDAKYILLTDYNVSELNLKKMNFDYVIVNYDQLKKYENILNKKVFDAVIVDESHLMANHDTIRTKMIFKLFSKVEKRILLTGTAIKNNPLDFFYQLKFLKKDLFNNKLQYAIRYCDGYENEYGWVFNGVSNLSELTRKISGFYIRRTKEEVLPFLPKKTRKLLHLDFDKKESKDYNQIIHEMKTIYKHQKNNPLFLMGKLRMKCAFLKLPHTVNYVKNFLKESEPNRKIIVFSNFIEVQEQLQKIFKDQSVAIVGDMNDKERNISESIFKNDPNIRVLIGATKVAGISLNLTSADTVIFNDLLYTFAEHEQAEDRVFRIGQNNPVEVVYPIFKHSIEELIMAIINKKAQIMDLILPEVNISSINDINDQNQVLSFIQNFIFIQS